MNRLFFLIFMWSSFLFSSPQILFLCQSKQIVKAIDLYFDKFEEEQKHDVEVLEQLGLILLYQGGKSSEAEEQILSVFGASKAGVSSSLEIYDIGIESRNPMTQMATLHLVAQMQDDRCEEVLAKAFHSPFLPVRIEAAYHLAQRKSHGATGMIESLMHRLPRPFWVYFPDLLALLGTPDSIALLRQLAADRDVPIRVASYLAASKHGRDDFLSYVRSAATHMNPMEQEAAATSLGYLNDAHSIDQLEKLAESSSPNVKLAALRSLDMIGKHEARKKIIEMAKEKNLHAINYLAKIPECEELLFRLAMDPNIHVRLNAALVLLKKRDPRALSPLMPLLFQYPDDLGAQTHHSGGGSLFAWKFVPSATQFAKKTKRDVLSPAHHLRMQILTDSLELGDEIFMRLAREILEKRVHDLTPLCIHLLENKKTPEAIDLLKEMSQKAGAPFIRAYCNLALVRLKIDGSYEKELFKWILDRQDSELIRFQPALPWVEQEGESPYNLTPEENSQLLIEAFETLAERHDANGISTILRAIQYGRKENRYALAGILLKAVQ